MLRNCYQKYYPLSDKSLRFSFCLILLCILFGTPAKAATQNYRLILTENPATSVTIGWELLSGCPDLQRVYYDTVDYGQDTSSYRFTASATASYFHQGMESYFSTLRALKPGSHYYFVIAEDEGISDRFWFRTRSSSNAPWQAFWVSQSLPRIPDTWKDTNVQIAEQQLDFVLEEGLSQLTTEDEWRAWLQSWQQSISPSGRITPLLVVGNISDDIRYLFNLPSKSVRQYFLGSKSVLLVSEKEKKLKKHVLKEIRPGSFVIQHISYPSYQSPEVVTLVISALRDSFQQSPNQFTFPEKQGFVKLNWQEGHLEVQSASGEKLLDAYAN